ncbi:MAG: hypothetical protein HC890_04530 [Chloroflexaceae bacterium]|nr:hypothetical protein [Chloroflexaceae bacterium]
MFNQVRSAFLLIPVKFHLLANRSFQDPILLKLIQLQDALSPQAIAQQTLGSNHPNTQTVQRNYQHMRDTQSSSSP